LRTYEALYIASPNVEDGDIQTLSQEVQDLVTQNGGTIVRSEIWGKRKLAYLVKKYSEGNYILLRFQANPDFIQKLELWFKLHDSVIRYLVTYFDEHTLKAEEEQARRKEEDLRKSAAGGRDDDDDDDEIIPARLQRNDRDDD
jgi:small subunit ribosomal protein S6